MLRGVIGVLLGWRLVVVSGVSGFQIYDCIRYCIAVLVSVSIKSCRMSNGVSLFSNFS